MNCNGTFWKGTINFDEKGDFIKFIALRFKGNNTDAMHYPWILRLTIILFEAIKMPSKKKPFWQPDKGYWTRLDLEITEIKFNKNKKTKKIAMDHVVYLDYKAKELENLRTGRKSMLIRGAMGRKLPYGKVSIGDNLFFIENKGDGVIKAKAVVSDVFNSKQLTKDESFKLLEHNQEKLWLDNGLLKRFGGKRYLVLIAIKDFSDIEFFKIDKRGYENMDDWLIVDNIENVKIK